MLDAPPGATELDAIQLERDRRVARTALGLLLVPTLWFLRTDLLLAAQSALLLNERLATRLVFLAIIVWGVVRLRAVPDRATYERRVLAVTLGTAACIMALNAMRPAGSSISLRTPLVWIFAYYSGLAMRFDRQVAAPLLVSAGFIALRLFWVTGTETGDVAGDVVVMLVMNAIGIQMLRHREAMQRRERILWTAEREARLALERTIGELKQLRGIIPICSYCKQVRSEVGDWRQIEEYVRDHSEADFSHGICPSCTQEHFPELVDANR